jgi:hypothetical protein
VKECVAEDFADFFASFSEVSLAMIDLLHDKQRFSAG